MTSFSSFEKRLYRIGWQRSEHLHLPDFICIGAPQSGTTWLFENLNAHAEVFIPAAKELRHFENVNRHQSLKYHYSRQFRTGAQKIKGDISPGYSIIEKRQIQFIKALMPRARLIMILRNPVDRTWAATRRVFSKDLFRFRCNAGLGIRSYLNRGTVGHYMRYLFTVKGCHLSTHISVTPVEPDSHWLLEDLSAHQTYSIRIRDGHITVCVSTPDHREAFKEGRFNDINDISVLSYMSSDHQAKLNDYGEILDNWLTVYPPEQLLVVPFQDLQSRPKDLLLEIFSHIGVSNSVDWTTFPYTKQINRNPEIPLPEKYREFLEGKYREGVRVWREIGLTGVRRTAVRVHHGRRVSHASTTSHK